MSDPVITYELPILDICAVFIAIIAIIVALISVYLQNQTRINTSNTVDELKLNRKQLIKMTALLVEVNKNLIS